MKRMSVWIMVMISLGVWAQSGEYDPEVQALMGKEANIVDKFKPENDAQKETHKAVKKYLSALATEDYEVSYAMISDAYKKYVSLVKYIKKDRLAVEKISLDKITFPSDECAVVRGYIWGYQGKLGSTIKVPIKEVFFKQEGEWRVFQNPFTNSMGLSHPFAKRFKVPCEEPEPVADASIRK